MLWTSFHSLNFSLDCPLLGRRSITTPRFRSSHPSKLIVEPWLLAWKLSCCRSCFLWITIALCNFWSLLMIKLSPEGPFLQCTQVPALCWYVAAAEKATSRSMHMKGNQETLHTIDVKRGKALRGIFDEVTF